MGTELTSIIKFACTLVLIFVILAIILNFGGDDDNNELY